MVEPRFGEPWWRIKPDSHGLIVTADDMPVCTGNDAEYEDRMLACVNALAGLNPEAVAEVIAAAKQLVSWSGNYLPRASDIEDLDRALRALEADE